MMSGSRELCQILHINRKAEIQCILRYTNEESDDDINSISNDIFGDSTMNVELDSVNRVVRGAARGLVEYIVNRMRTV